MTKCEQCTGNYISSRDATSCTCEAGKEENTDKTECGTSQTTYIFLYKQILNVSHT